jgi:hypothetical protein
MQVVAVGFAHMRAAPERKALPPIGKSYLSSYFQSIAADNNSPYEHTLVAVCTFYSSTETAPGDERSAHDRHQPRRVC